MYIKTVLYQSMWRYLMMKVNFEYLKKKKSLSDGEMQCVQVHYLCKNQATYFLALAVAEIWVFNLSGKI